jgi:hypothetical protein
MTWARRSEGGPVQAGPPLPPVVQAPKVYAIGIEDLS